MTLKVIILAAGKGTRMQSVLPKVLHPVGGKPMVQHVIDAASTLEPAKIILVHGYGSDAIIEQVRGDITYVHQKEQLGTGHAVAIAKEHIQDNDQVLVLYGDVPLTKSETLQRLIELKKQSDLALLTVEKSNPSGYGRIIRSEGEVTAIVEQKDATKEEALITECNTGMLCANGADIKRWLSNIKNTNAQNEYYLTDIVGMANLESKSIKATQPNNEVEVDGANDRVQLAKLERAYQLDNAHKAMLAGATLHDPQRFDVRGELKVGKEVIIDVNCVFIGNVTLEDGVKIGPNCVLDNCLIKKDVQIKANSLIESSTVGTSSEIGPFARLRPGTETGHHVKIGNFVETKKTLLKDGVKVGHLAYLGDASVGKSVNIGAGTIICNYDGHSKHQTVIGDDVFIGSNNSIVAPVQIGRMATTAAGSTITEDVKSEQLSVARSKQRNIVGWIRPKQRTK